MQRYMVMSTVLVLLVAVATAYAWQTPEDTVQQVGVLKHAKPNPELFNGEMDEKAPEAAADSPEVAALSLTPPTERDTTFSVDDLAKSQDSPEAAPSTSEDSPAEATVSETETTVSESAPVDEASFSDSQLGGISFSLDIGDNYQAVNPGYQFGEGFYTLYATFAYQGMSDGMNWAWSWQRNGAEIEGGNQVWSYGQQGPGYIYFQPEEGFRAGEYSLAIWVDDELQSQSSFSVSDSVAANN